SSRASTPSTRGQDADAQQLGFAELRSKSRPKPETSGLGTKPGHDELGDSRLGELSSARPMIAASRLTSPCPVTLSTSCPGFVPGIHVFDAGQDADAQQLGLAELRSESIPKPETPAWETKPGHDETCDATPEHMFWRKALQH